jgi:hypothetical protein
MMHVLTDATHPKNAKDDHTSMLTKTELMRLARWIDSNYQFYGAYYGRQHPQWLNSDPSNPAYDPANFRRRPTFNEATSFFAPDWHR